MFERVCGAVSSGIGRYHLRCVVPLIGVMVMFAGCAALQNREAIQTERLLAAAGFRMRLADTPEKLEHLKNMKQRSLVQYEHNGTVYYIYADATNCKCMYAGNQKAYQQYQKLAAQQRIADEERMTAEMNEDAAMNWGVWGPWGPWGPMMPWE